MATDWTDEQHPNTCFVCLDADKVLKFLPCHHSFCGPCIQHLADRHPGETFPCPVCRKRTFLPSGGVASLQVNFYTKPESPKSKRRKKDMCKIHSKVLEFYCTECIEALCLNCKLTKHDRHETEDLTQAVSKRMNELPAHRRRLKSAMSNVEKSVTSLREEKVALDQKRGAVEKEIQRRYEVEVAVAAAEREKSLASLQSMYGDIEQNVDITVSDKESHKRELANLIQQIDDVMASGAPSDVIIIAKEMTNGRGSREKIKVMTSQEERLLQRPVLQSDVTADVMVQTVSDYIGRVQISTVTGDRRPEVTVTQMFTCGEDPDIEVFSLYHEIDKDGVQTGMRVSFDRYHMNTDAPTKQFDTLSGECVDTSSIFSGKTSHTTYEGLAVATPTEPGRITTNCKSHAAHFLLYNCLSGTAVVGTNRVTCTDPFSEEFKTEFTIEVGPHRAFDVDVTGQHYVVLEEPKGSTARRSVLLYGQSEEKALSLYNPPVDNFAPSDVCFCSLGGRQVLLVTDEGRDEIHVVSIEGRDMKFERFLCPGCPSLIQPTALTVDIAGRLWVACRGGAVLMMEPCD